jgi:hypothetical protein
MLVIEWPAQRLDPRSHKFVKYKTIRIFVWKRIPLRIARLAWRGKKIIFWCYKSAKKLNFNACLRNR